MAEEIQVMWRKAAVLVGSSFAVAFPVQAKIDADRVIPAACPPTASIQVVVDIEVDEGQSAPASVVVREKLPPGWSIASSTPPVGRFDATSGEAEWVFVIGLNAQWTDTAFDISYTAELGENLESDPQEIEGGVMLDSEVETPIAGASTCNSGATGPAIVGLRDLPSQCPPGGEVAVDLDFDVDETRAAPASVVVREELPPGWSIVSSTPPVGRFDATSGEAEWVFVIGLNAQWADTAFDISYTARLESDVGTHVQELDGAVMLDTEAEVTIEGEGSCSAAATASPTAALPTNTPIPSIPTRTSTVASPAPFTATPTAPPESTPAASPTATLVPTSSPSPLPTLSPTPIPTATTPATTTPSATSSRTPTPTSAPEIECVGDCDGAGAVTVDEIVTMVVAALDGGIGGCLAGDPNLDGGITVDEIIDAINNALNGCSL